MRLGNSVQPVYLNLFANLCFALYTCVLGLVNGSWWFISLAAYYVILSIMRFVLLRFRKKEADGISERFIMRFTGVLFMIMSVVLAGTTYMAFSENKGFRYHEILMITIALYAFVKVTFAVINLTKSRKYVSPVMKTLRNIAFADALVSIFSLQRSMLVSFEGMSANDIALLNALTGSAVYLAVFLLGLNLMGGKKINMAKSKLIQANKKVAETVTGGYKAIEKGTVKSYKKIEDKFIDQFLTREGESIEDARKRLKDKK